jgi:acyl-CoA synthetase (AMP-forming)/AMP-acid ligase II
LLRTFKRPGRKLRWGQTFDLARFAGIQVFLHALLGGEIILSPGKCTLATRLDIFRALDCDAISATPTLWRKILMTPGHEILRLRQITLGGEIADQAILQQLQQTYPDAHLTHIYASTEAGAGFSVHDGKAGFPSTYLTSQAAGVEMKTDADGRLLVRTRSHKARYLNDAKIYADTEGFVDTGDLIRCEGDRCFFIGRANGSINIGGNKLHPQEVEAVLLGSPEVAAARIFARPNPITGQIVVAEIVPTQPGQDATLLKQHLRQHCATRLKRWQMPAVISIVPDLSMTAGQKLTRSL